MDKCADQVSRGGGWVSYCQLDAGHKGQHSNSVGFKWGEEEPQMTDNWNALTDGQRTKALALWLKLKDVGNLAGGMCFYYDETGDVQYFNPLSNLNHTALLWAALDDGQRILVLMELGDGNGVSTFELMPSILDPLKLSQAIYAVTVGQEEISDEH